MYLGGIKRAKYQLTNLLIFQILILMPFFAVSGLSHYTTSVMSRMFGGKKDILYSFMAQDTVDWLNVIYSIALQLISMITARNDFKKSHLPTVLIADDSDLPKTNKSIKIIGKIFAYSSEVYLIIRNSDALLERWP